MQTADKEMVAENFGKPLYYGQIPVLDANRDPVLDAEGNPVTHRGMLLAPVEDDMVDLGSGIPKFTYGITLNLEYKNFDLTVFGTGASGNKIYNLMVSADRPKINGLNVWWLDSSKQDENGNWIIGKYPDMRVAASDWVFFSSSANVFSGAYFKFKQIQLGYTFPTKLTQKVLISQLRLYVSLDDYFTITSYPGADPETASFDGGASRGWDNGNYPTSKKLVFGVNLAF